MTVLLILGVVIIAIGVLLLVAPSVLSSVSDFLNRKVFDDSAVLTHRIFVALVSLVVGALLLWMYFGHHINHFMK